MNQIQYAYGQLSVVSQDLKWAMPQKFINRINET